VGGRGGGGGGVGGGGGGQGGGGGGEVGSRRYCFSKTVWGSGKSFTTSGYKKINFFNHTKNFVAGSLDTWGTK